MTDWHDEYEAELKRHSAKMLRINQMHFGAWAFLIIFFSGLAWYWLYELSK